MSNKAEIKFNIAGSTFPCEGIYKNEDAAIYARGTLVNHMIAVDEKENLSVTVNREPDNKYDPDAINITVQNPSKSINVKVGYIPRAVKDVLPKPLLEELLQSKGTLESHTSITHKLNKSNLSLSAITIATVTGQDITDVVYLVMKTKTPLESDWLDIRSDRYCLSIKKIPEVEFGLNTNRL